MGFAHDTEVGLASAAALVNTGATPGDDELATPGRLREFVAEQRWSGPVAGDAAELAEVHALRDRLATLWRMDLDDLVAEVNALLREHRALPRLVAHDGWPHHLHATDDDAPLAGRMAVEAGMALVDVVRAGETDRLKSCDADGCTGVLADLSKNRSARFCGTTCANRTHVAAHRAPAAARPPRPTDDVRRGATLRHPDGVTLRDVHLERLRGRTFDTLVVGAGINGAVTAAAASGRGASVALVDRGDFASFTSQSSSNLVWGGFKYLQNYEIPLVIKLCRSRNRLMRSYPANIREISFYASLDEDAPYPPWFATMGAAAYWVLGQFGTQPPRYLSRGRIEDEEPVIDTSSVRGGLSYRDAYLVDNDARFVFSFVRSALEAGATVANYVEMTSAQRREGLWHVRLRDVDSGEEWTTTARTLVNAAGPFVDELNEQWGLSTEHRIVYSKGIHLVVPRLTTRHHQRVLAFFDDTQRLFYVIPMGRRSVIGTTDDRVDDPRTETTDDDVDFLLEQINARLDLAAPLTRDDVVADRVGVRPLVVEAGTGDHEDTELDEAQPQARRRDRPRARGGDGSSAASSPTASTSGRRSATSWPRSASASARTATTGTGEPGKESRAEFYRQARLMDLDGYRDKPDTEPLSDPPLAPVRAAGLRDARRDPRGPAHGHRRHGRRRLPARGALRDGAVGDGHEARGLPATALEDRARGALARDRGVAGPARGRRDPVRRRRGAPPRRVLRLPRPPAGPGAPGGAGRPVGRRGQQHRRRRRRLRRSDDGRAGRRARGVVGRITGV